MNLMFSTMFPAYHPRNGEQTGFVEKIFDGTKKHTVRKNYDYWAKCEGRRVTLCVWREKPYNSKQKPFTTAVARVNKIEIARWGAVYPVLTTIATYARRIGFYAIEDFARDDGLSIFDFQSWFHYDIGSIAGCACIWLDDVRRVAQ